MKIDITESMICQLLFRWYLIYLDRATQISKHIRGWLLSGQNNVRVGKGTVIRDVDINQGTTINDYCRLFGSPKISIGKNVYINCFTMMLGEIIIEDDVMISQYVNIWGWSHEFRHRDKPIWVQHGEGGQGYKIGRVLLKKGAWVGPHVTILRGVTIGEGAVIGAGAVVTKDIPDYAVAFGIPARVAYYRGDKDDQDR